MGSSSDAIVDQVIKYAGTPEEKTKINFHVEGGAIQVVI